MQTRQALFQEAERLRRGFERIKPFEMGAISCFPVDCCDHATNVTILHLLQLGWAAEQMTIFVGAVDPEKHRWLKVGGFHVDITADQFRRLDLPEVIVTDSSRWHESLTIDKTWPVTAEKAGKYRRQGAGEWHRKILESEAG